MAGAWEQTPTERIHVFHNGKFVYGGAEICPECYFGRCSSIEMAANTNPQENGL
jgi:hypothetical protein